jgi:hypothetical protein
MARTMILLFVARASKPAVVVVAEGRTTEWADLVR